MKPIPQCPMIKSLRLALGGAIFSLASCFLPTPMTVATETIRGRVIDKQTGLPVPGALVILTIARGGTLTEPSTYDLGHALTTEEGSFVIPAAPHRVLNVSSPDETPELGVFAREYNPTSFFNWSRKARDLHIKINYLGPGYPIDDPCEDRYYNKSTCDLVHMHLGMRYLF